MQTGKKLINHLNWKIAVAILTYYEGNAYVSNYLLDVTCKSFSFSFDWMVLLREWGTQRERERAIEVRVTLKRVHCLGSNTESLHGFELKWFDPWFFVEKLYNWWLFMVKQSFGCLNINNNGFFSIQYKLVWKVSPFICPISSWSNT